MSQIFEWLIKMENTKPLVLVVFFITFVLLVVYVYSNKKRSAQLESHKNIPFENEVENYQQLNEEKDEK